MTQQQLQVLKIAFWAVLGMTVIAMIGSITDKVIQTKRATRTEATQGSPIAVPAEPGSPAKN